MHNPFFTKLLIVIFIIICLSSIWLLIINDRWSDGDEVHYLVVTSSLAKDGDLVLDNNYKNKDYFVHHSHEEKPTAFRDKNGELRPPGGTLISIILVPAYKLSIFAKKILNFESNRWFLFFPRLTILILHIIFSIILIKYLRTSGFKKNISLLSIILFLIQLPILFYSQAIYTDLLSGYLIMTGIFGILMFARKQKYIWLIMSSMLFGLCMILHTKSIVLTGGLITSSFWYLFSSVYKIDFLKFKSWFKTYSNKFWKISSSLFAPWLGFLIINILIKFYWFGKFTFDGVGNKITSLGILSIIGNPLQGWLGQWLDIEVGLIPNAPLFALIITGLFIWFKKNKPTFILLMPVIIIYLLFNACYYEWHAGFSPSGRYLMIVLPLLLPSLAYILQTSQKIIWLRWIVGILAFFSLSLSSLISLVGRRGLPYFKGYNIYWRTILKFFRLDSLETIISLNFFEPGLSDYLLGVGIFVLLFGLGFYLQRKNFKTAKIQKISKKNN